MNNVLTFVRALGVMLLLVPAMVYPFLPGPYDALAVTLSAMAQAFSALGLLLVPIGVLWLAYEWMKRTRTRRNLPHKPKAFWFALVSLVVASVVMLVVTVITLGFGSYPASLLSVNKDYSASVVGIDRFHYAPQGEAYTVFFEQPRFFFDNIGTREFVAYNKLGQHVVPSHAAWVLIWSADRLAGNQGWYAIRDTARPDWKSFWFD